jgi:AcrR family transcriptional regulator
LPVQESRRERKKQQTKRLLMDTAITLFGEQGYEQTTVAQIAEAADVSTKTFFNYFPSKEDVLFADSGRGDAIPLEIIASRRPGEPITDLLLRAYEEMKADYLRNGIGPHGREAMATYIDLIRTVPALQARALHNAFRIQRQMAVALAEAYPDELDPISAAAVIGAFAGATQAAALKSIELDQPEDEFWHAVRRAVDIALHGPPRP